MKNRIIKIFVLLLFITSIWATNACKKDDTLEGIDKELFDMAVVTDGFTWYKNSDSLLDKSPGSGHSLPFLRTRYNAIAATNLDTNGKILPGTSFANGSLIVKELIRDDNTIVRYAILYKQSGNANADPKGWVWGYVNTDGTVEESATRKGGSCINCHSQTGSIDYMLMNIYFP